MSEAERTNGTYPAAITKRMFELIQKQPYLGDRISEINSLFQLLRDDEEAELILDLLLRAHCYHGREYELAADSLAHHIEVVWKLSPQTTCLVAKDLEDKASSADMAMQLVKTSLVRLNSAWTGGNFLGRMTQINSEKHFTNVVLVDDFIGTGRKISKKVDWINQNCPNIDSILVATMVAQVESKSIVDPVVTGYFAAAFVQKGITDHYVPLDVQKFIAAMQRIENRFGGISRSYSLGYDKTESIYFPMIMNTPNNVFPVFWKTSHQHDDEFKPILIRSGK